MCGIAGMVGLEAPEKVLDEMLHSMHRRGPDGKGVFRCGEATLLHSRLAVIDLDGGDQPMTVTWQGKTYTLVYNGELYNSVELRQDLEKLGHRFLGHSDTEVVLHAFAQYGETCLEKFNGIFAFAVWMSQERRLFLARDRIGVKPLFYKLHQNGLIFASEMKTLFCFPGVRGELDREGAAQLILLGPGRLPGSGVFRNVQELEPGCCGFFHQGKLTLRRYWKLRDRIHRDSFSETVEKVRWLVTDSIRRQMVSDVPVGTFLSGGLDSSLITAICSREMAQRGERLHTFSVDYAKQDQYFVPGKFQPNSDSSYIQIMQEHLNTLHHRTELTAEELVAYLEAATEARDLPGMADVDFSLLAFCRQIRPHVKVALSGECADEIFGGYPWYRDPEIREQFGFPWAQNTAQRTSLLRPGLYKDAQTMIQDAYEDTCRQCDILPENDPVERRMKQMVNLNFRWFMQTLLDRKDRMSMYSSLEVRVPFCDYRIAEYLYSVPWEYKDWQGKEKGLLRIAMEGMLPEAVLWRKKSPYPKTFDPNYARLIGQRLRSILDTRDNPLFEIVDPKAVEALYGPEPEWPWYGQLMRNPQAMAYLIQLEYWLRRYRVKLCF